MKTPEVIYKEILNNKISIEKGILQLIHYIQECKIEKTIFDCKRIFSDLSIKFNDTFNIISNFLKSSQKVITKLAIVKILFVNFPENSEILLKNQINRESSALLLTQFYNFLNTQKTEISTILRSYLIEKYKNLYNISIEECQFFIDLEATQVNVEKELDIKAGYFKKFETNDTELLRNNSYFHYVVRDYHIQALDLSRWEFNELPESIRFLSELEYLNLSNLKLKSLPVSLKNLLNLRDLNLNGNNIIKTPNWLFEFANKQVSKKYVNEGVISSDANTLALLELFLGEKLEKVEQEDDVTKWDLALNYKLNENGNAVGIYIKNENFKIGVFPEQICTLKFLEELELPESSIKYLPECIGNLRSLRYLNMYCNRIKSLPESIENLKELEFLDLDDNDLSENSLLNLRWYKIGQKYLEKHEFNDAINECKNTLEVYPKNKYAWYHLGVSYIEIGEFEEAETAFKSFLEIDESNSLVWSSLSDIYHQEAEYNKAIEAIRHAIDIEPNDAVLFSNLGFNYRKLGEYDNAIDAYLHSLEINPKNRHIWRELASIYRDKGEIMKAIEADERAFEIELNSNLNKE